MKTLFDFVVAPELPNAKPTVFLEAAAVDTRGGGEADDQPQPTTAAARARPKAQWQKTLGLCLDVFCP